MIQIISKKEPKGLIEGLEKRNKSVVFLKKIPQILADIVIYSGKFTDIINSIKETEKIHRAIFLVLDSKIKFTKEDVEALQKKSMKYYLYTKKYDVSQEELSDKLSVELYIDDQENIEEEILIDIISLEHN
ncbi:MAG: hypothetical protein ACMXX6_01770 [Candidatus Woesearchaeota archaeon]